MTCTPLSITHLRRSWLARRWPLYLWGVHDEHAVNYYTSEAFMTSIPLTITPLRRSWRAHRRPLHLYDGHDEYDGDRYTSEAVVINTSLPIISLRRSGHNEHAADHYTSELAFARTLLTFTLKNNVKYFHLVGNRNDYRWLPSFYTVREWL